jgi:GNAT superfamily N-acetyltransferase
MAGRSLYTVKTYVIWQSYSSTIRHYNGMSSRFSSIYYVSMIFTVIILSAIFRKEKESSQWYNVACILTMPFHQRKGYGKFLIDFSYLLSKRECKIATPERPLSDLGFVSYFSYWTQKLIEVIRECSDGNITINKLAELTSIKHTNILRVLEDLNFIRYHQGQHIILCDKNLLLMRFIRKLVGLGILWILKS